ncbi:MAG TPA: GTP cyclohydrolase IIa [Nitrososphaeraceae archaeon]|nr:GTP cyclohydrolase IIa [Nitrososphaeraceae archaeon]
MHLTVVKIDKYGPWTLTLGSDRESELQMLQAKIYYDIQRLFSEKCCIVYPNRFDEYFAVTNGLQIPDLVGIQQELSRLYPQLDLSMALGFGVTPYQADKNAHEARKSGVQVAFPRIYGYNSDSNQWSNEDGNIRIMHIDINGLSKLNSYMSPYQITSMIFKVYSKLVDTFMKKESLTFYLGGDNFMVVASNMHKGEIEKMLRMITDDTHVHLNCGIGKGRTGREAASSATRALDTIRELRDKGTHVSIYEI